MVKALQYKRIIEGFKLGSLGVSKNPKMRDTAKPHESSNKPTGFEQIEPTFVLWSESAQVWGKKLGWDREVQRDGSLTIGLHLEKDGAFQVLQIMLSVSVSGYSVLKATYQHKSIKFKLSLGTTWFDRFVPEIKHEGLKALKFPEGWNKVFEKKL
jgi:hypothetical protein